MRLKLTLDRPGANPADDVLVTVDTTVTVGELAETIRRRDPVAVGAAGPGGSGAGEVTLRIGGDDGRELDRTATLTEAGLRSGQRVALVAPSARFGDRTRTDAVAGSLVVRSGPDAGKELPLRFGTNQLGRGRENDVVLTDPQVSKVHARINVGEVVEIIDLGSSNGTEVGGDVVPRSVLRPDDVVTVGATRFQVVRTGGRAQSLSSIGTYDFNRTPRLDLVYEGEKHQAPGLPRRRPAGRVPIIPMIVPILLGSLMFAITRQLVTVLFVALSPVMMLGNVLESRIFGRREEQREFEAFRAQLSQLDDALTAAGAREAEQRRREHPATEECVAMANLRTPGLWSYQPDQRGFLELRLGLGALSTRDELELPQRGDAVAGAWEELLAVRDAHLEVPDVPVVAALPRCGSVGVAGPRSRVLDTARALVAQLIGLHSPSEVVLAAVVPSAAVPEWAWLKWLPHTLSEHSPLPVDHLSATPGSALRLVAALEELVEERRSGGPGAEPGPLPAVVVLVEDDAPVERSRLVELAEEGAGVGVHLLWLAEGFADLPAACRTFCELDPAESGQGRVGQVATGRSVRVRVETLGHEAATALARGLAPVVDAGARVDDDSDLPRSVSMLSLVGKELASSAEVVADRWATSGSLPGHANAAKRHSGLRAVVGASADGNMVLDLREQGPHALVGGTTGSGKSEFLQSWVLALALDHSPAQVTFLFVDYKGGAAFSECVHLPHSVGLVTDLSPHLVRRALTSLNAELRHREHVLQAKKAKDLLELQRRGDPEAPPSLVIVVDEFAALVSEVPDFVDGVVNVAQRGRSLGLHLILATQRPAGVIKDNLRANTNLRVALRMADEADSDDVVGTPQAASFDPSTPGRGIAKVGPGRLTSFQSSYVGGWTSDTPPRPVILVEPLPFGVGDRWEEPKGETDAPAPTGPNDLQRLVATVQRAHHDLGLADPRRPWLDSLAPVYDLARAPQSRTDAELVFGILDDPENQQQVPVAFEPDRDGNMAVYGTGGSGKSAVLRTLAVVAGLGFRGGPCHVYGLDFGARGLQMLEALPHVGSVIPGDDDERVQRLLRDLRATIDGRASRYAQARAATIDEYRRATSNPDEPRLLVLVDNIAAFRQAYEVGSQARYWDLFQGIAADGRQVGVHVVVTADRPAAVPSSLASVIQRRLVLRLASENDLATLGLPLDVFDAAAPPGRGFMDDHEVQVMVLGGSPNSSHQASAIDQLAGDLAGRGRAPAPPVRRLEDTVRLGELPTVVDGLPVLGIADDDLAPMGFTPRDVLLVSGPPQSGRTSVVATIGLALRRASTDDGRGFAYLGAGRSPLRSLLECATEGLGAAAIAETARDLAEGLAAGRGPQAIFLEDLATWSGTEAELPLQELVKAVRANDGFLVTEAETSSLGSWPLQMAVKAARFGIALQPDQFDGETIFKTPFPRVSRAEFPPGRGFYVRGGTARRVQCALPELT